MTAVKLSNTDYATLAQAQRDVACQIRDRCYGGNMPFAKRLRWSGEETGRSIAGTIRELTQPALVRLHTLGDFPSLSYAHAIRSALKTSRSAAFGFTHWQPETPIGSALRSLWDRDFCIRTSYLHGSREPISERSAVVVSHPDQASEHNAIVCPEQMGRVKSCAECAYCWHTTRPVAFVVHENLSRAALRVQAAA